MTGGSTNPDSALASLAAAADAARQAYMSAATEHPGADLSALYVQEMKALTLWSGAVAKALRPDPALPAVQRDLESATSAIRSDLAAVKTIDGWVTRLGSLVQLATKLAAYFA
jgi:hypothetical protein